MGTEYLECLSCTHAHLQVCVSSHALLFPPSLEAVVPQGSDLGNSATLVEQHTEEWMSRSLLYLSALHEFLLPGVVIPQDVKVPPMHPVPCVAWLLSVDVRDAATHLEETQARVTSIYGTILKMVSTKKASFDFCSTLYYCIITHIHIFLTLKMSKKLAGAAAGTAAWVTNLGIEDGQVLISVLTDSKGDGLLPMAAGLMRRYREARQAPPQVLYVDRDCCVKEQGNCSENLSSIHIRNVL